MSLFSVWPIRSRVSGTPYFAFRVCFGSRIIKCKAQSHLHGPTWAPPRRDVPPVWSTHIGHCWGNSPAPSGPAFCGLLLRTLKSTWALGFIQQQVSRTKTFETVISFPSWVRTTVHGTFPPWPTMTQVFIGHLRLWRKKAIKMNSFQKKEKSHLALNISSRCWDVSFPLLLLIKCIVVDPWQKI